MTPTLQSYKAAEAAAERILRDLADIETLFPIAAAGLRYDAEHVRRVSLIALRTLEEA